MALAIQNVTPAPPTLFSLPHSRVCTRVLAFPLRAYSCLRRRNAAATPTCSDRAPCVMDNPPIRHPDNPSPAAPLPRPHSTLPNTCLSPSRLTYAYLPRPSGKPLSLDPRQLYRGVFVNAASIGPISAVQYTTNGFLCSLHASIFNDVGGKMSNADTLAISASSGALSCAVVTPAELVMISQQRSGRTIVEECLKIWNSKGISGFFRGNTATCLREVCNIKLNVWLAGQMARRAWRAWQAYGRSVEEVANVSAASVASLRVHVVSGAELYVQCIPPPPPPPPRTHTHALFSHSILYQYPSIPPACILTAGGLDVWFPGSGACHQKLAPKRL